MKIFDRDIKVFAKKIMVTFILKINSSNIYIAIALINQNIIMLFQIIILVSKI